MGTYLSLSGRGKGVGTNSRLGTYSNKQGLYHYFDAHNIFPQTQGQLQEDA